MADGLTYSNVVEYLLAEIPELNDAYAEMLVSWKPDTPGNYIVYGDLLVDHIVELSSSIDDPKKHSALTRAMIHLEKLSAHQEWDVRCLAKIGVLEQLFGSKGRMERAAPFMGPATRSLALEYGELWLLEYEWIKNLPPAPWLSE